MAADWNELLLAFLHDPPDKALAVSSREQGPSHESRRLELAKALLGSDEFSQQKIKEVTAAVDVMAAKVERLPMPKRQHVNVQNGRLMIIHPLAAGASGASIELGVPDWKPSLLDEEKCELLRIAGNVPGQAEGLPLSRFLAVWRLWPDALTDKVDPCFARLPAETRTPDHTIWNHLDITAAMKAAEAEKGHAALLAFALGPVQRFIEAARSVRDLWSGSMILSWLAFRAMLPIIERLGPTAPIYPGLRGNPLLDLWLRDAQRLGGKVPPPDVRRRLTPSLPHRFLALVPWGADGSAARNLAGQCEEAVSRAWKEMAGEVRNKVKAKLNPLCADWDKRWNDQIDACFSATTAVIPLRGIGNNDQSATEHDNQLAELLAGESSFVAAFEHAENVRKMARAIPPDNAPGYPQDHAGRWQYQVELVNRALAAQRSIRHVPRTFASSSPNERHPQKCTLLGSFEQMGPDGLAESKNFWDKVADSANGVSIDGVRIRKGEALCAVAMAKRFAGPAFLAKELNVQPAELRFPDTWTVATVEWLSRAGIDPNDLRSKHGDWNGQWLHWETEQDDPDEPKCPAEVLKAIRAARDRLGKAPVYYAILKLDGDDLGGWLRGEKSPMVREVMHPDLVRYYEGLGDAAQKALEAWRPVGPALHAAISTALANFALHAVPEIVRRHHGTTIYSGGDDTLVLLPVSTALACALELRAAYRSEWYPDNADEQNSHRYQMMGSRATISGGLVAVHAKDDLRLALQDARRAERQAKEAGKDALVITVRRRSGEHTSELCLWELAKTVDNWRQQFAAGASDRWAYHLYAERPTLEKLPVEAIKAEMRRQLDRAEAPTPSLLPPDELVATFDRFRESSVKIDGGSDRRFPSLDAALRAFLTLCHTASFLARGRD